MAITRLGTNSITGLPDGIVSSASLASGVGGKVLQVVNVVYGVETTSGSSTYSDTGLSASITPSSSSNKVLVLVSQNGQRKQNNNTYLDIKLLRNSTDIVASFENRGAYNNASGNFWGGGNGICYLDSPATTSATTYKTQFKSVQNNDLVHIQESGCKSAITLLEISVW